MSKMGPSTPAEYGAVARQALWRFAAQTRLTGAVRDQAAVAMVRSRFPKTQGVFTDAQLAAVLREPGGRCSWDALRMLTAAGDERMPTEATAELTALLGNPCSRCRTTFEAQKVARRERALLAAASRYTPAPTGVLWPAGQEPTAVVAAARAAARKAAPPSYYQPRSSR